MALHRTIIELKIFYILKAKKGVFDFSSPLKFMVPSFKHMLNSVHTPTPCFFHILLLHVYALKFSFSPFMGGTVINKYHHHQQ